MPGDDDGDDERLRKLTDPANPRTPLHFKLLDHQRGGGASLRLHAGTSAHHRTDGYACGATAGSPKPISKVFGKAE